MPSLFDNLPGCRRLLKPPATAKAGQERDRRCATCGKVTRHRLRIVRADGEAERRWVCVVCCDSRLAGDLWCPLCGGSRMLVETACDGVRGARPRAKIRIRKCQTPRCPGRWLTVERIERAY